MPDAPSPSRTAASQSRSPGGSSTDLAWLVLLGAIWGSAFPVIRLGLNAGISPLPLGAARFGIAAVIMAILSLRGRAPWPSCRDAAKLAVLGGAAFVGAYAAFLNLGEVTIPAGLSAILVGTLPLWTVLFSSAFLRQERVGAIGALGVATGFAGLLVLFLPTLQGGVTAFTIGELWVICAAISAAASTVLIRRFVPISPGTKGLTIEFSVAALMLAALSFVPGVGANLPLNRNAVVAILYLAILPSGVGFAIFFDLMGRVGPLGANLVSYVNPLAGVGIGVVLLAERVTVVELVGFGLVVSGLLLFQFGGRWLRGRTIRPRDRATPTGERS